MRSNIYVWINWFLLWIYIHIKNQFHASVYSGDIEFSGILQLGWSRAHLDMPDYIKLKSLKQFAVSLDIYQKRFKISTSYTYSRVIIDLSFWRTLGMSYHGRLSPINFLLIYKKSTSFFNSFLTYWTFRNLTIWAVESSSLTRIQDLELCPTWKLEWEVKN